MPLEMYIQFYFVISYVEKPYQVVFYHFLLSQIFNIHKTFFHQIY